MNVKRPLAATMEETDKFEGVSDEWENPAGTISKYWNPGPERSKLNQGVAESSKDDPVLRSVHTGRDWIIDADSIENQEDVPMDIASGASDDGHVDVLEKLDGILCRQSAESAEKNANNEREVTVQNNGITSYRRHSRDSDARSSQRGRSRSPSSDLSSRKYRMRSPPAQPPMSLPQPPHVKMRPVHALPPKPQLTMAPAQHSSGGANKHTDGWHNHKYTSFPDIQRRTNHRSRSGSPDRARGSRNHAKGRYRDYDMKRNGYGVPLEQHRKGSFKGPVKQSHNYT